MAEDEGGMPSDETWSEENSRDFLALADVFVPRREELVATLCGLIPAAQDERFTVAELGAGDGTLARAVLTAFPQCHYLALERSEVLRAALAHSLGAFGERVTIQPFELAAGEWSTVLAQPVRAVLSSLVVHHLDGAGKRALFAALAQRLEAGGALLFADIIAATTPQTTALFARQWDDETRARSLALRGDLRAYDSFRRIGWNYFLDPLGDPIDQPSPLLDQLLWLREAGLRGVDCYWLYAGHAIYGGYGD